MELPNPGDTFEEKYQVHQVIGRGGFATVYRATDTDVGRDVALKILSPRDGGYPDAVVARFMREARLLAGLQDPHTITMYDFGGTDDGLLFMVFEYVKGEDLSELLKRRGRLEPDEVKHILKQVLFALREAHDVGVLHRDIKPPNLLVYEYMDEPNCVKLLDFGVAKPQESHPLGPANLTKKGAMVGTPRYMAPEQIFGKKLSASADLYSLGLVAFEMLTGRPAMDGRTNKERVRQQLSKTPTLVPEEFGTPALRSVINRLVEKDVTLRYQSASEALAALRSGKIEPSRKRPVRKTLPPEEIMDTIDETAGPSPSTVGLNLYQVLLIGMLTAGSGVLVLVLGGAFSDRAEVVQLGGDEHGGSAERGPKDRPANAGAGEPPDPPVAAGVKPPPPGSDGCARNDITPGRHERTFMLGLVERPWLLYVPKNYDSKKRHATMLMFHGMFTKPSKFLAETRMEELADEQDLVLIVPAAESEAADWKAVENYEMLPKVLNQARGEVCLSEQLVYAMGHGRGGWFARDIGCYLPISATAVTGSGQKVGEKVCRPLPPVPTIRLFGNKDKFVPAKGGSSCVGGDYLSAEAIDDEWLERYRCDAKPEMWYSHSNGECTTWSCEAEGAKYVSCELDGGHDWPGMSPPQLTLPACAATPPEFPFRDTIWRFFETEGRTL